MFADLHMHTTHSDGELTPTQLVDEAILRGLQVIAITDHDTISAIKEATEYAGNRIKIIPSLELSCEYQGIEVHILGHFIDHTNIKLNEELLKYQEIRQNRASDIVQKLKDVMGVEISYEAVLKNSKGKSIGRPHIAQELLREGHVQSMNEAFDMYLKENSKAFVPKFKVSVQDGIKLIHDAGGISIWAHPGVNNADHFLPDFIKQGLDGIEVFYPSHDDRTQDKYFNLASVNNLLVSGGSDFHNSLGRSLLGDSGLSSKQFSKLEPKHQGRSKSKT